MYGLTEAFRSTSLDPALLDAHPDSMGSAIPFAEIMVVGADGGEAGGGRAGPCRAAWSPRAIGGIRRGPPSASGPRPPAPIMAAWRSGRATASAATRQGLLYFVGREDGMIKSSGNRVSPTEIEEAALASGLVAEAVALGFPDARLGEGIALDRPPRPPRRGGGVARLPEAPASQFHAARADPLARRAAAQPERQA